MLRTIVGMTVLACSLLLSCTVSDKSPDLVLKPEGEKVEVMFARGTMQQGELLCVDDTTIYLLIEKRVWSAPLSTVTTAYIKGYELKLSKDIAAKLKPYSRYPQGLSSAQWQQLLDHLGQAAILPRGS